MNEEMRKILNPTPAEMREKLERDANLVDGVWYWKSNGNVPPEDFLEEAEVDAETRVRCDEVRDRQFAEFLNEYRRNQPEQPSDEERFEARAAHGPGVELVDVLSGRRFTT